MKKNIVIKCKACGTVFPIVSFKNRIKFLCWTVLSASVLITLINYLLHGNYDIINTIRNGSAGANFFLINVMLGCICLSAIINYAVMMNFYGRKCPNCGNKNW